MAHEVMAFLSRPRFNCLNFHDPTSLSEDEIANVILALENLHIFFLIKIGYQPQKPADQSDQIYLQRNLHVWAKNNLAEWYNAIEIEELVLQATLRVEGYHPRSQIDFKEHIGIIILISLVIEARVGPSNIEFSKQVERFSSKFLENLPQPAGILTELEKHIQSLPSMLKAASNRKPDHHIMTMAMTSCLNFTDGVVLENKFRTNPLVQLTYPHSIHRRAPCETLYPQFICNLTGLGLLHVTTAFSSHAYPEGPAVPIENWIMGIVELENFVNMTKNLLSLPLEIRRGGNSNPLFSITQTKRKSNCVTRFPNRYGDGLWTFRDSLEETLQILINATLTLDKIFSAPPSILESEFENDGECTYPSKPQTWKIDRIKMARKLWKDLKNGCVGANIAISCEGFGDLLGDYPPRECFGPQEEDGMIGKKKCVPTSAKKDAIFKKNWRSNDQ